MERNRIISMLVVIALVLSTFMFTTAVADRREVTTDGNAEWILSNDGFGSRAQNLTPGEIITLKVTNNSLTKNTNYRMRVWNGTQWNNLTIDGSKTADDYGDLEISFHVPGWSELGANPVTANGTNNWSYAGASAAGQWNVSLFHNNYTGPVFESLNATIKIGNQYLLKFYDDGEEIEHLIYDKTYSPFTVNVYNWTGDELELADDDATKYKFDAYLLNYSDDGATGTDGNYFNDDGIGYLLGSDLLDGVSDDKTFFTNDIMIPTDDKEKTFWVYVNHSDDSALNSTIALPVLLDLTDPSPADGQKWGDSFSVAGEVLDGAGSGMSPYTVRVYCPVKGGYTVAKETGPTAFDTDGSYSTNINTGSGKGFGAGTWYVGTYVTGATGRVDMSDQAPYKENFIPYYSFEVGAKDTATVTIENTDDIVKGFAQTINVSVENETWMDNDEFKEMNIHVTGIKGYYGGVEYGRSDIALVSPTLKGTSDNLQYYEFDYMFNETGNARIWASWPGNMTKRDYFDDSYSDTYGNHSTSLMENITGTTTLSVISPDAMTILVDNVPETVQKEDASCDSGWKNISTAWTLISVYGSTEDSHKNATIQVTGCGLDFTIDEDDTTHDNLIEKNFDDSGSGAWYNVSIIPKTAGTLTITATNDTTTVTKDYTVTGITGTVSTSVGDDLEITVGTTETITLTGVTEYAETKITFFDENWDCQTRLNASDEAGEFVFTPEADDINKIGYIVVMAGVTGLDMWMYDIIEVVPVDDLTINVSTPAEGNQTLTVGMEQDIVVHLLDDNGDAVTDDTPTVEAKLIDADHDEDDPLQTFTLDNQGGGEWEATITPYYKGQLLITGENASSGVKHIGETTLDVDYATVTYLPDGATAGLDTEDITVDVTAVDANGNPLDVTTLHLHAEDDSGNLDFDSTVDLTDGAGEFDIAVVGDLKTHINATLDSAAPANGNRTLGKFNIDFPNFDINPDTIYIGQSNEITITATDINGDPVKGLNLTLWGATLNGTGNQPDPVKTDSDGEVIFSITPSSSGVVNVTIARNLEYVGGELTWTNAVITDSYITITSIKTFQISVSKSPITEGETLTVTVTDGVNPVNEANVEFAGTTKATDSDGKATFTAPDPMVESVTYYVEVSKEGFNTKDKGVTVVKKYDMSIAGPSEDVETGKSFTVTVIAKGSSLAGATVTFEGATVTSNGEGKATFTAPDSEGTYEVTASHDDYTADATLDITVEKAEGGTPGFELLTLIAAIGVAFILLRRRRNK